MFSVCWWLYGKDLMCQSVCVCVCERERERERAFPFLYVRCFVSTTKHLTLLYSSCRLWWLLYVQEQDTERLGDRWTKFFCKVKIVTLGGGQRTSTFMILLILVVVAVAAATLASFVYVGCMSGG